MTNSIKRSLCLEMVFRDDPFLERIEHASELGVDAVEFWEWRTKDLDAVVESVREHDLELVGMVGLGESEPSLTSAEEFERAVDYIEESIRVAEKVDCPNLIVLSGQEQPDESRAKQHQRVVDGLRSVTTASEDAGVTLLLEPLNRSVDHPDYFLESSAQGFDIVDEVGSPAVQLLYDTYHQQISEGNIIDTIGRNLDRIGHFHIADVPGRHEPGTGEINYPNVLDAVSEMGYDGYVGYEFEPAADSITAVRGIFDK